MSFHGIELYDGTQSWIVTEHRDICGVLASEKLSADGPHTSYSLIHEGGKKARVAQPTCHNLDPPEHDEQRALLQDAFDRDAIDKLQPIVDEVVKRHRRRLSKGNRS